MARKAKGRGTVGAAPLPIVASFVGPAPFPYPFPNIGSTEFAARIIGVRHRLSPAVARTIVELVGIGGAA